MRKNLNPIIVASGIAFLGLIQLQGTANAQEPIGPPKPMVVVNSPDKPIPVTGSVQVSGGLQVTNTPTVDARQSGPWSVSLSGTPTVGIDSNNNTVKVVRNGTRLVSNNNINYANGAVTFNIVDISEYSKVRVQFANSGNSDVQVTIFSQDLSALPQVYLFEYETFTVPALGRVNRLYDTLGTIVNMQFTSSGSGSVRVGVFGN